MENLNQQIQSKLALEIAQLSLDKATLQAQFEQLQQQNAELQTTTKRSYCTRRSRKRRITLWHLKRLKQLIY